MASYSTGAENVFNAEQLLKESKVDIAVIMYILGIEHSLIESITIDEIIEKIKVSYDYRNAELNLASIDSATALAVPATVSFLRVECNSIIRRTRRAWFNMEFALEVLENER